jgi:hypothetical protein
VLTNPYFIAVGIPLLLILCGALAKKLVRGSEWEVSDFFLGVELALSAMAAALVYVFDLAKLSSHNPIPLDLHQQITATSTFVAFSFFLLLWLMTAHQDWEKRSENKKGQVIWLVIVANFVGAALLTSFVLFVKGV